MNKACKNCRYFKHIHVDSGKCKKFDSDESKNSICDSWEEGAIIEYNPVTDPDVPEQFKTELLKYINNTSTSSYHYIPESFMSSVVDKGTWSTTSTTSYKYEAKLYIANELWKTMTLEKPSNKIEIKWLPPLQPGPPDQTISVFENYKIFVFNLTNSSTLRYDLMEIL